MFVFTSEETYLIHRRKVLMLLYTLTVGKLVGGHLFSLSSVEKSNYITYGRPLRIHLLISFVDVIRQNLCEKLDRYRTTYY